ncbi:hypothetical protein [Nonomuraea sp. 10N515B]|uniref:hypothetical protein n=1 Tax=Nonomuraea sp. 10N515B TaxID=3457422 RepID=UPI003FCE5A03
MKWPILRRSTPEASRTTIEPSAEIDRPSAWAGMAVSAEAAPVSAAAWRRAQRRLS